MSVHLNDLSQAAWPIVIDAVVKGVIVLAAAWAAATTLMRRASAAARHLAWVLAVVATLALPLLAGVLPGWRVLPAWMGRDAVATTTVADPPPIAESARARVDAVPAGTLHEVNHGMGGTSQFAERSAGKTFPALAASEPTTARAFVTLAEPVPPASPAPPTASSSDWTWRTWLLAAWASGAAIMLLPIVVSLLGLWRLSRRCGTIDGKSWLILLRDSAERLNLARPVTLLRGRPMAMPMTWGILRPKLLLPSDADQWPPDRRRVVLMHELAHIKRADFLTQLLVHLARALYWFNPLIWVAAKQSAIESEGACDDLVLTRQTKASDYAEHLLTVAAGLKDAALLPAAAVAMARSSRLEKRLLCILDAKRNRRAITVAGISLGVALLAGVVLPLASARPADAANQAGNPTVTAAAPKEAGAGNPDEASKGEADQPPAKGELSGTVTDAAGKPLAGVLVDAWTWYAGNETRTDAQGRFRLTKLNDEPVEVRISKDGFSPWYRHDQPTGERRLDVRLSSDTYFEGVVAAPDGKPVADALVRADSGPKSNPSVHISTVWTETRSDADGRYRLYVAPDAYVLQVRVPKVGAARLAKTTISEGQSKKLDITLTPGATFRAIIVDAQTGAPLPNVRLSNWEHKGLESTSDQEGNVMIDQMPQGRFRLQVAADGYRRWWSEQAIENYQKREGREKFQRNFDDLDFNITADMTPVRIELERAVRISGVMHDPDGNPVAGATVAPALTGTANSITGDTRFSVTTAIDGTFTLTLPASHHVKYNLVAHDGAYKQWRKWANGVAPPMQTRPGDELKDVTIKLTRPAIVRGRAKDESGKPLAGRDVRASAADKLENRYYDPSTTTDKDGNFELRFIRPGEQFIQVAPFFWTNVPDGGMTLKLKEGQTNSLRVTLKEGEVREGVELTGPASTKFPSQEEQLQRILEKVDKEKNAQATPTIDVSERGRTDDDLKSLPESIEELSLRGPFGYGMDKITDEGVHHLERYTKLRILKLGAFHLTDRALESIGKLHALEELHLDVNKITGEGLDHLAGLKNLRRLDLSSNPLRPESFATLATMGSLTHLSVENSYPADDQTLEQLAKLKQLQELRLTYQSQRVTKRGLAHLVSLKHLRNLVVPGAADVTDADLMRLAELPDLRELTITDPRSITPDGLRFLGKLPDLRSLQLAGVPLDERAMRDIGGLAKLQDLLLWNVAGQPVSLEPLGQLKSLRRLRTNLPVSSSAIRALSGVETLESIGDQLTEISDEDVARLARLPNLQSLILGSSKLTAKSLESLAKMKSLRQLQVTADVPIMPRQWTDLGRESLRDCTIQLHFAPYTVFHEARRD